MNIFVLNSSALCGLALCVGLASPVLATVTPSGTSTVAATTTSAAPAARSAASAPAKQAAPKTSAAPSAVAVRAIRNVAYGPDARQRFDVYVPAKPSGPVILLVGGMDWAKGDKAARDLLGNKVRHWSQQGVVVVSVNYRLLPKVKPLGQATDVAAALAKAQAQAPDWGADPSRFVLMGHSSGAHLVTLLNTAPKLALQAGAKSWRATVSVDSTAFDLEALMSAPHAALYDRAFGKNVDDWRAASPYHVLAEKAVPPILFLCSKTEGDACDQALHFERKAAKLGHRIVIWQQFMSHRDIMRNLGDKGTHTDMVDIWLRSVM